MSTLTLQPSASSGIDTNISEAAPTTNLGTGTTLTIGNMFIISDQALRALLRFDLSSIPTGSLITSATLTLFQVSGDIGASRTFYAYRVVQTAWTEASATWNKYDGTNNWATAGLGAGTDYVVTDGDSVAIATPSDLTFDGLSALCNDAYANRSGFLHLVIIGPEDVGETEQMVVGSSDNATSGLRPRLVVEYEYSTHYRAALAVQGGIQALALEGLTSARVLVQKNPQPPEGGEPCIVCSYWQREAMNPRGGTNLRDEVGYPVTVSLYAGANQGQALNGPRTNLWRQRIMRYFNEQRLSGMDESTICRIEPDAVFDPSYFSANIDKSSFNVRCQTLVRRGTLAAGGVS